MYTLPIKEKYNLECKRKSDINEHLPILKKHALDCTHVTEMGVRSVVSTWALLDARPNKLISIDINYHENIETAKNRAIKEGINFEFIQDSTLNIQIEETDLLFIDTYHTYGQLKQELNLHSSKVKKYIILHDTTKFGKLGEGKQEGLWKAVLEFLHVNKEWTIKERLQNNNGLTILTKAQQLPNKIINIDSPSICWVIGTYSSIPLIHLQLENHKRLFKSHEIIIHDDCSHDKNKIKELCDEYNAKFISPEIRLSQRWGDINTFICGLENTNSNILIKNSRSFLYKKDPSLEIINAFNNFQYPTLSGVDIDKKWGFRTDSVAMWTPIWKQLLPDLKKCFYNGEHPLVENYIHMCAIRAYNLSKNTHREKFENIFPRSYNSSGYWFMPYKGMNQKDENEQILWHYSNTINDYYNLSLEYNLPYSYEDFNMIEKNRVDEYNNHIRPSHMAISYFK